jgi:hypothetical protein
MPDKQPDHRHVSRRYRFATLGANYLGIAYLATGSVHQRRPTAVVPGVDICRNR